MDKIKQLWAEKPLELMATITALGIAGSKVVESISGARSKHAYAKQINRNSRPKKK